MTTSDPICAYLLAFNLLMTGDAPAARQAIGPLAGATDEPLITMCLRLQGMLARADRLMAAGLLHKTALTAWHMALNGTILLHESPHGHPEPMQGRYAYVGDNAALMREGLHRLRLVLGDAIPPRIVHAPDRASRVLATAMAKDLQLPLIAWSSGLPLDHSLVVAWTLDDVGDAGFLSAAKGHAPGNVLFAHGSAWVDPFPYAPDVTTFLYQTAAHPWTGGALTRDGRAAPDPRSDVELADAILAAPLAADGDGSASTTAHVVAVRDAVRGLEGEAAAGLDRDAGPRALQRRGSVVPSARFT